jgi:hypothetical protein
MDRPALRISVDVQSRTSIACWMVRRSADPMTAIIVQKGKPGGGEQRDRLSDDFGRGLDAPPASLFWAPARIAGRPRHCECREP